MSMAEEGLNLEGEWWIPDNKGQKFKGTLTFDRQRKGHILTITAGRSFEISEMGKNHRAKPEHDIILGETRDGQKVTAGEASQQRFFYSF